MPIFLLSHLKVSCPSPLQIPKCAFPKNKDILLSNHTTAIKIRKLRLIHESI